MMSSFAEANPNVIVRTLSRDRSLQFKCVKSPARVGTEAPAPGWAIRLPWSAGSAPSVALEQVR